MTRYSMMQHSALLLLCALAVAVAGGCSDDLPNTPIPPDNVDGVYVLNEGNFQRANASLSFYVPAGDSLYNDVFTAVNGRDLGDTGNSLTIHDGRAYIVVNGSNRIEVINTRTHAFVHTIVCPPGASPRQIAFDANGVGYISNLYANSVSIYDPATRTIMGEVAVGANPEGLLVAGGHVFVANSGFGSGRTVSAISTATRTVVAAIPVGDNPQAIVAVDATTALVLCTGAYNDWSDPNDDTPGTLYWIDLADRGVKDSLVLGGHPQRLAVDARGHAYTVAEDGITRVDLATKQITPRFIPGSFYGLAVASSLKRIYVTEPLDYVQSGRFVVYSDAGVRLAAHAAGIIPGAIAIVE